MTFVLYQSQVRHEWYDAFKQKEGFNITLIQDKLLCSMAEEINQDIIFGKIKQVRYFLPLRNLNWHLLSLLSSLSSTHLIHMPLRTQSQIHRLLLVTLLPVHLTSAPFTIPLPPCLLHRCHLSATLLPPCHYFILPPCTCCDFSPADPATMPILQTL